MMPGKLEYVAVVSVHHPFVWWKPMRYICAAIRFFTKSYWNHSAILVKEKGRSDYIVEMGAKGIERSEYVEWCEDKIIHVHKPTFKYDKQHMMLIISLLLKLKMKYDYRGTFWYQLLYSIGKFINRIFGTNIKWMGFTSAGRAAQKFYCSELVAFLFHETSGFLEEWYKMSPSHLFEKMVYMGSDSRFHGEASKMPLKL